MELRLTIVNNVNLDIMKMHMEIVFLINIMYVGMFLIFLLMSVREHNKKHIVDFLSRIDL